MPYRKNVEGCVLCFICGRLPFPKCNELRGGEKKKSPGPCQNPWVVDVTSLHPPLPPLLLLLLSL